MFANFFKNLIVSSFGSYIEDFTAKDIEIDKWNGCVVKQNCIIKKNALEGIMMSLVGAPVTVVRGYIQNLRINVPWSKLLSSPVQINLDEIHVVLKASSAYDAQFAKRQILKAKKQKVQELLDQIKKSQAKIDQKGASQVEEADSYMKRLRKIVSENLQITVKNVHIRFEDSFCSRKDQMLNFGIIFSQLNYSMTNSNYEKVFINIDDKKREQRSYSMLEISNLACYWNSNAKENWHKSKDFLNLSASKHIDHSKKFVDSLRKKYQQFQQNLTLNNVFLIQPCDIRMRFRKNLSPHNFLDVPKSTTAIEISVLQLSIDEEIYKDTQYMAKFFSWHQKGSSENKHFKFRPPYNMPIQGNASQYWRYAISSTVYYIRKTKREKNLKQKRQVETIELSELYFMQQMNEYYERNGYQQRILQSSLSAQDTGSQPLEILISSAQELEDRVQKLETKLSPEQIVIALKRAEKKSQARIQDEITNSGWKSWLPGKLKNFYSSSVSSQTATDQSVSGNELKEFDEMIHNFEGIEDDEELPDESNPDMSSQHLATDISHQNASPNLKEFKSNGFALKTHSHLGLIIPKIDIAFISKKQGSQSKYFMELLISEFVYQSVANSKESQILLYFRNLEIIDKLIDKLKFSRAIYKREKGQKLANQIVKRNIASKIKFNGTNSSGLVGKTGERYQERGEIDEEANTNINNGLPLIQDYEQILSQQEQDAPFLVLQMNKRSYHQKGEKEKHYQYRVEFFMNSMQIFYNRLLIQRAQTFINTATLSRTQNLSAEADFDTRLQQFKQSTEDKVKQMLKRSEIFVTCNVKGFEALVPDNTNYDASKFLIFQTGNLVIRNGQPSHSHFTLRNRLSNLIKSHKIGSETTSSDKLQEEDNQLLNFDFDEDYSLTLYDTVIYYLPSFQQLENFNFIENQNEFQRFEIVKKTDFHTDLQIKTEQIENEKIERKYLVQAGLNQIELLLTNKEIKELKHFVDNFVRYHEQISNEVQRELQYLEHMNLQQTHFEREFSRIHRRSFDLENEDETNEIEKEQDMMLQTIISNQKSVSLFKSQLSDTNTSLQHIVNAFQGQGQFSSFENNMHSLNSDRNFLSLEEAKNNQVYTDPNKIQESDGEDDDDEFFDAQDVFDQDIIQMLKLDKNFEKVKEENTLENAGQVQNRNDIVQNKVIFEFWINRVKINILEAANLQKDIIQGLQSKLGNFFIRDQIEFDIGFKGVPFLLFEINKFGALYISVKQNSYYAVCLQELALINMDNSSVLKRSQSVIMKSQNYDYDEFLEQPELSPTNNQHQYNNLGSNFFRETPLRNYSKTYGKSKAQTIQDPEDEDRINTQENQNQETEQFLTLTFSSNQTEDVKIMNTQSKIGLIEFYMGENLLNKIIQTLVTDFPQSSSVSKKGQQNIGSKYKGQTQSQTNIEWEGLTCKINVKKDITNFKLMNLTLQSDYQQDQNSYQLQLGELRVLQNDQELFLKSIEAIDEYDRMLDLKINISQHYNDQTNIFNGKEVSQDEETKVQENQKASSIKIQTINDSDQVKDKKVVRFAETLIEQEIKNKEVKNIASNHNIATVNADLNLIVAVLDTKNIGIMLNSLQKIIKILGREQSKSKSKEESSNNVEIRISLNNSYVQVPLRDNKNGLYLRIKDLTLDQTKQGMKISYEQLLVFIAKSQFQEALYPLILSENLHLSLQQGLKAVEMSLLTFTLNENYILFLANLVDNHFEDMLLIQEKLELLKAQSLSQPVLAQQSFGQTSLKEDSNQEKNQNDIDNTQALTDDQILSNLKQVQLCEQMKINLQKMGPISLIQSLKIDNMSADWIFGLGFDDHEDNFVTLFNKNQSQQILQQFDQEQDVMVKQNDLDFADNLNRKASQIFSQGIDFQTLNSQNQETHDYFGNFSKNYESVKIEILELNCNVIQYEENETASQSLVAQFDILRMFQRSSSAKPSSFLSIERSDIVNPAFQLNQRKKHANYDVDKISITISNQSARIISNLCKSVYSCKNILKRGKKRELLKKLFDSQQQDAAADQINMSSQDFLSKKISFSLLINKWKLSLGILQEKNANQNPEANSSQTLMQMLSNKPRKDLESEVAEDNYMLVVEGKLDVRKYYKKKHKLQQQTFQYGDFFDVNVSKITSYLDPASKGLSDLINSHVGTVILIHPFDLSISSISFLPAMNKENTIYIDLKLIEVELSLRQVFFIKAMIEKIKEEFQPLVQVIQHFQQNQEKAAKRNQAQAKLFQSQAKKKSQQQMISVQLDAGYLVLLKESGDNSSIKDQLCLPIFSVELKGAKLDIQNNSFGSITQLISGGSQLEAYYFNQRLNFYEPFIEKTKLEIIIQNGKHKSQSIEVKVAKQMNINFSVAFYETVFFFQNTLKEEQAQYEVKAVLQKGIIQGKSQKDLKLSSSQFFIKNSTGETLMFKTTHQPTFFELQPEEQNELDFDVQPSDGLFMSQVYAQRDRGSNLMSSFAEQQLNENIEKDKEDSFEIGQYEDEDFVEILKDGFQPVQPQSKYRREKLRYLRGEAKKVFIQVIIAQEQLVEKSSVFEINLENLSCQRIYLDEQRQIYIICQMINKHGSKNLIIRSPMQVTNNLQIPLELQLIQSMKSLIQKQSLEESILEDKQIFMSGDTRSFDIIIMPEQSMTIPLKACGFEQLRMRPTTVNNRQSNKSRKEQNLFEWTQLIDMSLLQDEREIFEKKPMILSSKILNADISQRRNDQLFFILNANVYSIRSFIDFNTQQTEFISLKYLQISPPFTIQNLLPVALSLVFKNIIRDPQLQDNSLTNQIQNKKVKDPYMKDKQHYILETKMNSSNQTLFLNPLGNFQMSICIPGFDNSTFVDLKREDEEDYKMSENIDQDNYIQGLFEEDEEQKVNQDEQLGQESDLLRIEQQKQEKSNVQMKMKNQFRFLKQKKLLFQLTSQFQNQFNVCANFAYVQGFYHICFYSKYWFLNNTLMPLEIQMTTENFSFDKYDLPYENIDFDFDTISRFIRQDDESEMNINQNEAFDKNGKSLKGQQKHDTNIKHGRKNSLDSFQTETVKEGKSQAKYSFTKSQTNKHNEYQDNLNYKELQAALSKSNPYGHNRIKPWESYKINDGLNQGLIAALTNEDINKVSTIYMAQEMLIDEEAQDKQEFEEEKKDSKDDKQIKQHIKSRRQIEDTKISKKSVRFFAQNSTLIDEITSQGQEEYKQKMEAYQMQQERQTMISKTSIQYLNYHDFLAEKDILPLNHLQISRPSLFETPLQDKDQLKRVILFSDSPVEDQIYQDQQLRIKISDSHWSNIPFDINKIQGQSISIQDKQRLNQRQSLFEIVSQVQYLPYPFSFSKLITFNSRYTIVNKTYQTLYVIQSECEENGIFKVYPQETSIFHWTDAIKEYYVSVKLEDYEYSGKFPIDQIGEFNIRLKSTFDNDCVILNVLINEENNQFFLVVSDISYAPPYRIENLTKTTFKLAQQDSRSDDFDIIKPFGIISFAWSYPLGNKLLAISICSQSQDSYLGPYNIDHINKNHTLILKDKKNQRDFILEIINEKSIKVVRIMNAANAPVHTELIHNQEFKDQKESTQKFKCNFKSLGLSIVNSQAREIAYITLDGLKLSKQKTNKNKKISIKCHSVQIDNQLVRQNDAIVLKKQLGSETSKQLILKMHTLDNQAIENLYYYKYFFLQMAPFDLNIDGNFCDESYKYLADLLSLANRYSIEDNQVNQEELLTGGKNHPFGENNEEDLSDKNAQIKKTFDDLKKPLFEKRLAVEGAQSHNAQKKVFFEQMLINDIKLNFSFHASPMLFREFSMNPTIKFIIVLLSNLKNVSLKFSQYKLAHQHLLLPIFINQVKKHYVQQCYSHQQFLEIVTSMGLFGNLSQSADSLKYAFRSLQNPLKSGPKQMFKGGAMFLKYTFSALLSPVGAVLGSMQNGLYYLVSSNRASNSDSDNYDINQLTMDRDLFEDDLSQASKELNAISSPLALIDTQNRIWIKIISREKQNYEVKKKQLKKRYQGLNQSEYGAENQKSLSLQSQGNVRKFINSASQQQRMHDMGQRSIASYFLKGATQTVKCAWYIPKAVFESVWFVGKWVNYQISDEQQALLPQKKRYPRFVNIRMELESYNEQKALALQILNDINLNGVESENIQRVFQFKKNSIIFTAKRLICVASNKNKLTNVRVYEHWNILFKDILRVSNKAIVKGEQNEMQWNEFKEMLDSQRDLLSKVSLILRIYYHQVVDSDSQEDSYIENQSGSVSLRHNSERLKHGMSGRYKGQTAGGLGMDLFGDLRIGEKKIKAYHYECKKMNSLYRHLSRMINSINIIK